MREGRRVPAIENMATAGALFRKTLSQTCWSCEAKTKYSCISCDRPVCVRLECSVAELDEEAEGWEPGKRVGYCLLCARICTRTSTPRSPEASISANLVDKTSSRSKLNDQGSDLSSDSEEKEPQVPNKKRRKQNEDGHSESPEETAVKGKKRGRKATWLEIQVTDMVNIIVNDENILRKLVFTNTKKAYNTEAYQSVLNKLNEQYEDSFPFTVEQMRTKFKWCVATCKRICLTVKTASGVKRLTDEKGYGKWFDLLYPIVKSRDSCQPEQAREPSANESSAKEIIEHGSSDCSPVEDSTKEPPEKSMFVPVKRKGRKHKSDQIASTVDLIRSVIENDPTKQLLESIHEEMKLAREQEKRYLDILLGSGQQPFQQYQHHGAYSSTHMFSNNGVPGNQTQTGSQCRHKTTSKIIFDV